MADVPTIHGTVDPRFEGVREAFARNFAEADELGASVYVMVDGEAVVDLWGGLADQESGRPWERDTLVNVWSSTKGVLATAAHMLVDRGLIDIDAPVARYWPEFAQQGKGGITVRWLMSHQAGLPAVDGDDELPALACQDWELMTRALAATKPQWEPGTKHGYHTVTFGWLVGELIRRVTGETPGDFIRREIAEPLGAPFYLGVPDEVHPQIATLEAQPVGGSTASGFTPNPQSLTARSILLSTPPLAGHPNSAGWRRAQMPGMNGHASARGMARIYSALSLGGSAHGVTLMRPETLDRAHTIQAEGPDAVLIMKTRRSLGYMHPVMETGDRRGPDAFGHNGAGGSMAFADRTHRIAFGYVMNRMWQGGLMTPDPRAQRLAGAVYAALA
ncbi:MAG: class A beta-lactamase-related serine hydrolase [Dehalococcoidia bacterium]|nr:MAG: class A beta-lactamase-related serine hydrolase [Dehalococcoidia bacterium]